MAAQKAKVVHGPGPRGMGGPRPKVENPGKLLKRIMAEVFQHYLPHCILVLICIVVSALANVQASLFLQTLIDDYIIPMTQQQDPSFAPLAGALVRVGCIYVVGILAAWLNARIMVNVTQGTLRNLRTQLFTHMESLPISYFDTHPHGDIMSVYTNDVDTLRQMLSQSIPQLVSSAITIVSVFASMCMLSWQLTIVTMLMVALMLFCSKKITQQSGKYFIAQQRDLGKVNGYIEEMMEGQKVVKVFTHEQKTLEGFRELNDKLKDSAKQANSFANIMMPVNAQLGNISYAICALVGAAMAVTGMGGVTLGTVMAFLSLNKSFNMPISQVSMQANSIIMALAGAERIFKMMDDLRKLFYRNFTVSAYLCDDHMSETDPGTDRADHIRIVLVIHCGKQQSQRKFLLEMFCCLYKLLDTVFVMCAIHDHTRKNRFHPSLPACFCHTGLQRLQRYRDLIFQYLNGFHRKSCIHNLITSNKRYIKYGIAIYLVLKRKPDSVLCDLMDFCIFPFQLIIWTSQFLCMLTHHSGRIRIISIVDHRNTRHHDPCLLSCDLGNCISKILHMIEADGCDHTGCRILHSSGKQER